MQHTISALHWLKLKVVCFAVWLAVNHPHSLRFLEDLFFMLCIFNRLNIGSNVVMSWLDKARAAIHTALSMSR